MNILAFLSQGTDADSLEEDAMWSMIDCEYDDDENPTTLVDGGDGYLYVGTTDLIAPYQASIYRWDSSTCEKWQDTDDFSIYSSTVFHDIVFWGTRYDRYTTQGQLRTYNPSNGTFGLIDESIWWGGVVPASKGAWLQTFYSWGAADRLYVGGSIMDDKPPWNNNFYVKYCLDATGSCYSSGDWYWTDTDSSRLGLIDDLLSMVMDDSFLIYAGTYDWASVIFYSYLNNSWWYSLNGTVDGPYGKDAQGVYGLVYDQGCVFAFTFKYGWNWTRCGGTWESTNLSTNDGFARSVVYRNELYHGTSDASSYAIGTYDNNSFEKVFTDDDSSHFRYFTEFNDELYATSDTGLYRRRTSATPVEITSPNQGESTKHYINLIASVDESTKTAVGCTFLLSSKYYECHEISSNVWAYIDLNTRHIANGKYTLTLQVNWSDDTYSKDSLDFFISNTQPTYLDGIEDENGNIIYLDNPPHKPKWGTTRSEEWNEVVDPYLTVIWDVIDTPSAGTSVNLYLPYRTNEGSVTVVSDELHVNGQASTDRIWINDTSPTIIVNRTALYHFDLLGSGNVNYTVESEATLTVTRKSTIRIVREFNWTKDASTSTWYHQSTFENEVDSSNTIRNVWFYWSMPKETTLDQKSIHVYDNDNNVELDLSRHFSVDYGGFQLELDSLAYSSTRSFTLEFQELSETSSDRIIVAIYDNDIQMDSTFAEAPWKFTKTIAQPNSDFEGSVIFAFKMQSPAKSRPINPKSIIVERDGRLIDNWIYEPVTDQILLFAEEIEARETTEYEVYFDFEEPLDVVINVAFESILAITLCSFVMIFFSYKPMVDEKEKKFRRIIALGVFIGGWALLIWAIILVV
jgi:hypothetical protein